VVIIHRIISLSVIFSGFLLAGYLSMAAAAEKAVATASATVASSSAIASGAAEDSRSACMARVPKDASAGQRMMAEQSCDRDDSTRKSIHAVPGR
jgi:hypothetical protein